ncbi:copper resistance CopC/CopD family protein [Paludifilum halophilum]|uniref:CopC domain-containing protein n=1 Tax=Paludifilum halophilum TaxID=1642702 RepID=A0A235B561_9BACL|nr:copper resistance protein CopC [Paludifilum halophilum]OYD07450.1 hypothetical protein CHM34_11145 [Paludifilum halophilum]
MQKGFGIGKKAATVLFCLLLLSCWMAPPLYAHAGLLDTSPQKGEVLKEPPEELRLRFSEPIERELADVRLYDWNGHRTDLSEPENSDGRSETLLYPLPDLKNGTYTIVWSVVSGDGHPVSGSFRFSIGEETGGADLASAEESGWADFFLVLTRYLVEGLILVGAGVYWMARFGRRYGLPDFKQVLGRGRIIAGILLPVGMIGEWTAYSATLPGVNLFALWWEGKWSLLFQFPFVLMIFIQLLVFLLLILPGMTRGWYGMMWLILTGVPAVGGHVWGMENPGVAIVSRVLHLMTAAVWSGGLTYLILVLIGRKRRKKDQSPISSFRPFFVRAALIASASVLVTGTVMVFLQTDVSAVLEDRGRWNGLLLLKILLTGLMLGLALVQTLRWRQEGHRISRPLLRWEWAAGLIVILAGVWISQTPYPLPSHSYEAVWKTDSVPVEVEISNLGIGQRTMTVRFPKEAQPPEDVTILMDMVDHGMETEPVTAEKISAGQYQADLPFTMVGDWQLTVRAEYPGGEEREWQETVFIPGGGNP